MKKLIYIILFVILWTVPMSVVDAAFNARIFVSPYSGKYNVGDLFSVVIYVDTGTQPINAVTGQLTFDNSKLEVVSVSSSKSILTLWPQEPGFSNGTGSITFSGGLPSPGFFGKNGTILRITFRPKNVGTANIKFSSASLLANDGQGTNVIVDLEDANFEILPKKEIPKQGPETETVKTEPLNQSGTVTKLLEAPIITDWPRQLIRGDSLQIKGLGLSNARIQINIQKDSELPTIKETISGTDGRFEAEISKYTEAGFYRIQARNVTYTGGQSELSDPVVVYVVEPNYVRIGGLVISYFKIIMTLLAILIIVLIILFILWRRSRKNDLRKGKKISEVEKSVHKSFDNLKQDLYDYIRFMASSKNKNEIKNKEFMARNELDKELKKIEDEVDQDIEKIKLD